MKILTYFCENCLEPYDFDASNNKGEFKCPKCGEKMMYLETDEVDPNTSRVINAYQEFDRKNANPGKPVISKPTVECPYCHSNDTKKITNTSKAVHTALFGIFAMGKVSKQWHCNQCNSDF